MPKLLGVRLPTPLLNLVVGPVARLGLGPRGLHLLGVPGRRTGRMYRTPVTLVETGRERWLVAPYGERNWVKNARAAGWVELRRGRRVERVAVAETAPAERAQVLREYLRRYPRTRDLFEAAPGAPLDAFAEEAARYPVFRLVEHRGGPQGARLDAPTS